MSTNANSILQKLADKKRAMESSVRDLAGRISNLERDLNRIHMKEGALLERFAKIHIELKVPNLPKNIDAMLQKREREIERARREVAVAEDLVKDLTAKRKELEKQEAAAYKELSTVIADAGERLNSNEQAASLRLEIAQLEEKVEGLREKLARANEELKTKARPYEDDKIFTYLRQRKFGTAAYSGWLWAKNIDAWLANLISYRKKIADYERLHAIPTWISERKEGVASLLEGKQYALNTIKNEIFGSTRAQESAYQDAKKALAEIVEEIYSQNQILSSSSRFISDAAMSNDHEMKKASNAYADALANLGLADLRLAAKRTQSGEDDLIVEELSSLAKEKTLIQTEISNLMPGLNELNRRISGISKVEHDMRSKGWTGPSDRFSSTISDRKIDELASGMITASAIWAELSRAYRPEISSTRYSSNSNSWGSPSSSPSSSSWGSDSGGFGGSSSSWSSGGGFGGGDSSSGGGF